MTTALAHTYTVANNAAVTDFAICRLLPTPRTALCSPGRNLGCMVGCGFLSPCCGRQRHYYLSFLSYTAPTDNTASEFVSPVIHTGQVATAGVGKWYIRARVTDTQNYDSRAYTPAITMNPYDEIDLNTTTLAWGV